MPLREDLLAPIAGENPCGEDLYYDRVFEQIKEARREDADDLPEGDWERTQKKKADFRAVIKLAGDALAKRTKDVRLAAWLVEAHIRTEGFQVIAPGIELLRGLQETFWETFYPIIEDGDLELRMLSIETAGRLIAAAARKVPLTRSGFNYEDYLQSRVIGYEKDATSDAKQEARRDAIDHGKLTAEEFDQGFAATPKSFYVDTEATLAESLAAVETLDSFQQEKYGENSPNLQKLTEGLTEVHQVAALLLNERRKTEPDPVPKAAPQPLEGGAETSADGQPAAYPGESYGVPGPRALPSAAELGGQDDAYGLVVACAGFLFEQNPHSPVPYLLCASLRLGETRMQESLPAPGFAVGPSSEIRQSLRSLAGRGEWMELLRAALPILAHECARAWLDLHRYIWRAAQETGADAISAAVVGTVRSLLIVQPELRHWTLEDDTGAANPETQQWLDSTVLQ
jgi:type VI secretion system protein ImpA